MNRLNWLILFFILFFSSPLFALRCGHLLVEPGDYKDDVYDKCGSPNSVQSHYERRGNVNQAQINQFSLNSRPNLNYGQTYYQDVEVLVEEWKYDFGSSRLRKLLRFENGRLKEIIDLGRRR